jgi:hypothetical protein
LTLGLFGKRRPQTPADTGPEPVVLSRLQDITRTDIVMYEAMSRLLFIDPGKVTTTLEEAASQASKYEASGDRTRAEVWYRIAGGIALYKGDAQGVRKFFEKAASFAEVPKQEYTTAANRAQEAVDIARKYYEII